MELRRVPAAVVATAFAAALALAAQAAASPSAPACRITQGDAVGPFQGTGGAGPRRAKIGTGHVLTGRILRFPDCKPIRGALVDLWQSGRSGYDRRGRASVVTDRQGRFRFEGPVPFSYGRQPHIHIRVFVGGYEELLTRYVVAPGRRSGRITLVLDPLL